MDDLLVHGLYVFTHPFLFAQHEAVVGIHHQHGVPPQIVLIHLVQHQSQVVVAHAHQGGIFVSNVGGGFVTIFIFAVIGPVQVFAVIVIGV